MLKALTIGSNDDDDLNGTQQEQQAQWLPSFYSDFRRRAVNLLGREFRRFPGLLALSLITRRKKSENAAADEAIGASELSGHVSHHDLARLERYKNNQADYHLVMDLVPTLARLYFTRGLKPELSAHQRLLLAAMGLQNKSVEEVEAEMAAAQPAGQQQQTMKATQLLGLFNKMMNKFEAAVRARLEGAIAERLASETPRAVSGTNGNGQPSETMEEELEKAGEEAEAERKREAALASLDLEELARYRIKGSDENWERALKKGGSALLSVKSGEKRVGDDPPEGAAKKKKKKKTKA